MDNIKVSSVKLVLSTNDLSLILQDLINKSELKKHLK